MLLRTLLVSLGPVAAYQGMAPRMAGSVQTQPRAAVAQLPTWNVRSLPAPRLRMQVEEDIKKEDIYDDFMGLDETGASVPLALDEKEKLYLECLDSFYNEGGKAILPDNKYEQLKVDLEFSESRIMTYSKNEIRYLLANKRFKMGKPVLTDSEYDALRLQLKKEGSSVAMHDAPRCDMDTGVCKMDLRVDKGKTRLLYLPGWAGGLIFFSEVSYWTLHLDPLLSILLGVIPVYFFANWFTTNIFAQKPLVVTSPCPSCSQLMTVYFGDLLNVQTDGIIPKASGPPQSQIEAICGSCKETLIADRDTMIIATLPKKVKA
jgi:hypothetical protein